MRSVLTRVLDQLARLCALLGGLMLVGGYLAGMSLTSLAALLVMKVRPVAEVVPVEGP